MINTAALALAFTAGLVATVNPCGFAMLPAYLSYFTGTTESNVSRPVALARGLRVGIMVSAGFVAVFGSAGLLLTLGLQSLVDFLPWLALAVGVGIFGLGVAMVRGFYLNVRLPGLRGAKKERTNRSMFLFGISYAVASLSCTLPVFLSLIPANLSQGSLLGGMLTFVVYGLGMSTVLVFITLMMALGRDSVVRRMRQTGRYINTVSGMILIAAGLFIIWYWATILVAGGVAAGQSGVVRFVDEVSAWMTNMIGSNTRPVAGLLILVIGGVILYISGSRVFGNNGADATQPPDADQPVRTPAGHTPAGD